METEIHGFCSVIHGITMTEIDKMCDEILCINHGLFKRSKFGDATILRYSFGKAKESVYIRTSASAERSYCIMNLKGTFFDYSPDFKLENLLEFLPNYNYTPKQIDIAFNDNDMCLTRKELKYWCREYKDFCAGSLVARNAPETVFQRGKFRRIQLGSAKSKTNYGTIYRRPDTKFIRIEIKLKQKDKIAYLLDRYKSDDLQLFESRSLEMLVGCINFITRLSKRTRTPSKYKMQKSWESFLNSDIQKPNWSKIYKEKAKKREQIDLAGSQKSALRLGTMTSNLMKKGELLGHKDEIIKAIARNSGYAFTEVCEDL